MQSFDSIMKFIFVATGVSSTWSWLRLNSSRFLFVCVTDYFFDALELGIDERARSISAKCYLAPGDGKTYGSLISFHSPTITWLSVMLPISFLLAGENQCYCYRRHDNTVIAKYVFVCCTLRRKRTRSLVFLSHFCLSALKRTLPWVRMQLLLSFCCVSTSSSLLYSVVYVWHLLVRTQLVRKLKAHPIRVVNRKFCFVK